MFNLPESVKYNNGKYKILTPNGYENFIGVNKIEKDRYVWLKFTNGKEIKCSEDHPFLTVDGFILAKNLNKRTEIITKSSGCFVSSKRTIKRKIELYDIVNSGKYHFYYTNEIVSHNCEFLGSSNTLVSGDKLAYMVHQTPLGKKFEAVIYENPIKESVDYETGNTIADHKYIACVDVSEGKNLDYSAIIVIDVSTIPYKQVAVYKSNSIPPILLPTVIKNIAEFYNEAFVLVEINNNPQVASVLIEELGYDNVFRVSSGNKQAQTATLSWGRNCACGVRMSALVKRIGCSQLKTLLENDKLVLIDFDTISELTTFVQLGNTFKAEEGRHDDLVITLVIFAWLTTQNLFKEMLEQDLRKQLQREHFDKTIEDDTPIIGFTNGDEDEQIVEDNAVWTVYDNFSHIQNYFG